MERFMKYAVETAQCHDIHNNFNEDWFRHSKVDRRDTHTHRQHGDLKACLHFIRNKESKLK
jgi:hypothetical protein